MSVVAPGGGGPAGPPEEGAPVPGRRPRRRGRLRGGGPGCRRDTSLGRGEERPLGRLLEGRWRGRLLERRVQRRQRGRVVEGFAVVGGVLGLVHGRRHVGLVLGRLGRRRLGLLVRALGLGVPVRDLGGGCRSCSRGQRVPVDRDRRLGVHAGGVDRRAEARIADVVGEGRGDLVRGLDRQRVLGGLLVQHPLADHVEGARHPGADLTRPEGTTRLAGCGRHGRAGDAGPPTGQGGVEDAGEVDHVCLALVQLAVQRVRRSWSLEGGVDDVPDQLHCSGVGDEHRLRVQPTVGDALRVAGGDGLGDLTGEPGRARGRQGALLQHQVERDAVTPLVDHPGDAVVVGAVEDAEQVRVGDRRRDAGGLEQVRRSFVGARHRVDRHAARQDRVRGPPEAGAVALGEQVVEPVAPGEDGAGADRAGHRGPCGCGRVRCLLTSHHPSRSTPSSQTWDRDCSLPIVGPVVVAAGHTCMTLSAPRAHAGRPARGPR